MTSLNFMDERREIIDTCLKMNALGVNQGSSGNVSLRIPSGFLITPSGIPYDEMRPEDIVEMDFDGNIKGARLPSSEWRFHFDILKARPEAGAVIHTHAVYCTTLACRRMSIPAFHYMVAVAGGDSIACAPYATFGTRELSDNALAALEGRKACLLANHGMICFHDNLKKALALALEIETLARQYVQVLQLGEPILLSDAQMAEVLERFKTYGKQPGEDEESGEGA